MLTDQNKIFYLANIIAAAHADGKLSPKEEQVLSEIQKRIKAKKTLFIQARKMVESGQFALQPVGGFIDKLSNLEDMLYIVYVDGDLDETEKQIVLQFAEKIKITPEQFNEIKSDVLDLLNSAPVICPNCKSKCSSDAKFCPQCGANLQEVEGGKTVQVSYSIPSKGIAIEFAESTSASFPSAFQKASSAPTFQQCVKGKKKWFLAAWPLSQIAEALELAQELDMLRHRKVYIDGEEQKWQDVFAFLWCYFNRSNAYDPLEYCFGLSHKTFNIWGCINSRMDWVDSADWFYGNFETKGVLKKRVFFVFDKKKIEHELKTNIFAYRYCPFLNFKLIDAIFKAFPERVEVSDLGDWDYKREYHELPGSIRVKRTVTENGYTYTDDFYARTVVPKGLSTGIEILKKAVDFCGLSELSVFLNEKLK